MDTSEGEDEQRRASIRLAKGEAVLAAARDFAAEVAVAAGQDRLADDVALLVSELITNALLHGAEPIALTVQVSGRRIRLEVEDAATTMPRLLDALRGAEHGHGLEIVAGLADRWGADRVPGDGKIVWAELRGNGAD